MCFMSNSAAQWPQREQSVWVDNGGLMRAAFCKPWEADLKVYSVALVLRTAVWVLLPSEGTKDMCTLLTAAWWAAWTSQLSQTWEDDTLTTCSCSTRRGPGTETHTYYVFTSIKACGCTHTFQQLQLWKKGCGERKMRSLVRISAVAGRLESLLLVLSLMDTVEMLYSTPGSRSRRTWVDRCLSR